MYNDSSAECWIVMFLVIVNINSVVVVNFMTKKYSLFVLTGLFSVPICEVTRHTD